MSCEWLHHPWFHCAPLFHRCTVSKAPRDSVYITTIWAPSGAHILPVYKCSHYFYVVSPPSPCFSVVLSVPAKCLGCCGQEVHFQFCECNIILWPLPSVNTFPRSSNWIGDTAPLLICPTVFILDFQFAEPTLFESMAHMNVRKYNIVILFVHGSHMLVNTRVIIRSAKWPSKHYANVEYGARCSDGSHADCKRQQYKKLS